MNRKLLSALGALAFLTVTIGAHAGESLFPKTLLKFHTMVGNSPPYTEDGGVLIRGMEGGPKPWTLTRAVGELRADGSLRMRIQGLIIPASAGVGNNPAPYFQAVVSCRTLTVNSAGQYFKNMVTHKEDTRMIGDTTRGDARIDARLNLPNPCIAPIVFVTSPSRVEPPFGYWFAATGFQRDVNGAGPGS